MSYNRIDRPLGKIIHIINGEAIVHPITSFVGKGAKVVLSDQTEIGRLGDPFGLVHHPFQPIILNSKIDSKNFDKLIGEQVYAQIAKKSKRSKSRSRRRSKKR